MSFSVTTVNVNGVRAAVRERNSGNRGLLPWLGAATGARFVLLQEIRATEEQARIALAPALDSGWRLAMAESTVRGHAGVGILSTEPIVAVRPGMRSAEFADTGRYLEVDVAETTDHPALTLGSVYVPKGAADGEAFDAKSRFLDEFGDHLRTIVRRRRGVLVGGDWNIAHTERDVKNWRGNRLSPGFLPHERRWVGDLLHARWHDVARDHAGEVDGPYSWWSWRGKAFDTDAGWRIDYHLTNAMLARRVRAVGVERAAAYDQRWSDHAPVTVEFAGADVGRARMTGWNP